ncbi:MAG TPA: AbrB/MazE/SpoVT family DNA-binding domain-containing protein [Rhizomicrobium sp.]
MTIRATVTAEIVAIGNSKGVRIPKAMREQAGLEGEVTLTVADGALIIRPKHGPRSDWPERFGRAAKADELLIPDSLGTDFDSDWTW